MNFNIDRFLKQFKWDVLQNYRFVYVFYMVIFGLMLFFTSVNIHGGSGQYHSSFFWFTLFLGGLIFTSSLFDELNQTQSKQLYLTTPSSHLEKFGSKLFLSTVVYTVLTMVVFMIMSFVATMVLELRTGNNLPSFNPFYSENIESVKSYLIIQSIFLLGAVTFRQAAFFKTLAVILGIGFVFSVIWATVGLGTMSQYLPFNGDIDLNVSDIDKDGIEGSMKTYAQVLKWLYLLLLAPIMWLITYFKLTEKEV